MILSFIIAMMFFQSCGNTNNADTSTMCDYQKLEQLVSNYDAVKDIELYRKNEAYVIADSLAVFLKKINPNSVINDTSFLKLTGELLEKKYLAVRSLSDSPKAFFVYNVSNWAIQRECTQYILNVQRKMSLKEDEKFDDYVNKITDFYCIDTLVLAIEKMNTKSESHIKCLDLVKKQETGGCKW